MTNHNEAIARAHERIATGWRIGYEPDFWDWETGIVYGAFCVFNTQDREETACGPFTRDRALRVYREAVVAEGVNW